MFHVCEEGRRQSSFLCPRGTIFNQVSLFSFWNIRQKKKCNIHICPGVPSLRLVVQCQVWEQRGILWPQPRSHDSGADAVGQRKWSYAYSRHIPGPAKELTRLFIISNCSCPWPRSLQLSWGWPKPGTLLLQGPDLIVTRSSFDCLFVTFAGWLWLARFRTRPFRHIRNIQFTFLIAFKTISLFNPL